MKKRFVCRMRGYRITLPKALQQKLKQNSILFSDTDPVIETDNQDIIDYIENCKAYKEGVIYKEPTAEELEAERIRKEQEKNLSNYRRLYDDGILKIDETVPEKTILKVAQDIGVETTQKGKPLSRKVLIRKVLEKLEEKK